MARGDIVMLQKHVSFEPRSPCITVRYTAVI